ncbi:MAG: WecB/TagA/CpsF family glycosyltransferase [Acidimicrobiales bacterium]|nr:WecB/TagA/CpsF family glycosyltransferase [Acidimicrobiales bacterium]
MTATMRRSDESVVQAPPLPVPPVRSWPRVRYGRVGVDALGFDETLVVLQERMTAGYGGYVVTPNTDHLVKARRSPSLAAIYDGAVLSLADGVPLVWMAKLLGLPVRQKVSGSDLLVPLLRASAAAAAPVFFLGTTPEVAQRAAAVAQELIPGVRYAGSASPMVQLDGDQQPVLDALDEARRHGARLVVVALGCPKQELTMARHAWRVPQATFVGLGASLDFLAGEVKRAPGWVSGAGLEWAFRLVQEPRRLWRRYLVDSFGALPVFADMALARLRTAPLVTERSGGAGPVAGVAAPVTIPAVPAGPVPVPTWAAFQGLNVSVPVAVDRGERRPTG